MQPYRYRWLEWCCYRTFSIAFYLNIRISNQFAQSYTICLLIRLIITVMNKQLERDLLCSIQSLKAFQLQNVLSHFIILADTHVDKNIASNFLSKCRKRNEFLVWNKCEKSVSKRLWEDLIRVSFKCYQRVVVNFSWKKYGCRQNNKIT